MFDIILEIMSYELLSRAVIVGVLISLCASLLGVILVLKRYSMIGDGLSHVGFGALAIATALNLAPLTFSIIVVIAAAFWLLHINQSNKVKGDSAIAVVATGSLAVGILFISVATGINTDVYNYMFGSILAMDKNDLRLSVILSAIVLVLFMLFYHKIFAVTFDETFSRAVGANIEIYNILLAILTSITIVLGMRMMGAVLISALIIFPPLTSMRICKQFKTVVIFSAISSLFCFLIGFYLSFRYYLPTGASVVTVNLAALILCSLVGTIKDNLCKKRS